MKRILFLSLALLALSSCAKKEDNQKAVRKDTIDYDTVATQDTIIIADESGVLVGTYIPNTEYKSEHRITINSQNGEISEMHLTMILHR